MFRQFLKYLIGISLIVHCATLCIATPVKVGRYLTMNMNTHANQQHLLQQVITVRFPEYCTTIGEAMTFLMQFSGYGLAKPDLLSKRAQTLLKKPLAVINRQFGPASLHEIMQTLIGPTFQLLIDPVHRLIGFQLYTIYQPLYDVSYWKNLPIQLNGEEK